MTSGNLNAPQFLGGEDEDKMKEISSSVESFSPLLGKNVKFKMKESTSSTAAFFKESES